jgi:hypothetical protein
MEVLKTIGLAIVLVVGVLIAAIFYFAWMAVAIIIVLITNLFT